MENKFLQTAQIWYRTTAFLVLNTLLFFIFINLVLYLFTQSGNIVQGQQMELPAEQIADYELVYPDLTEEEILSLREFPHFPPFIYAPYVQFIERPLDTELVQVDVNGFRHGRDQGPWPPDPNAFNVFVFGGSTTFGFRVPDYNTIPSYLQEKLSKANDQQVYVYNFGHLGYFSTQERILFQQLLLDGHFPDIAIFIDGLNEIYHIDGVPSHTSLFEQFVETYGTSPTILETLQPLPFFQIAQRVQSSLSPSDLNQPLYPPDPDDELAAHLANRYLSNKQMIVQIADLYNISTLFVWQPVPTYNYDIEHHLFSGHISDFSKSYLGVTYQYMDEIHNDQTVIGTNFLWLGDMQESLKIPLYVDGFHYSAEMNDMIAEQIYVWLLDSEE